MIKKIIKKKELCMIIMLIKKDINGLENLFKKIRYNLLPDILFKFKKIFRLVRLNY